MKQTSTFLQSLLIGLLWCFALEQVQAQAPNISYPNSLTYIVGTPISPLTPTNTGGTPKGVLVSTLAGSGTAAYADGTGTAASFSEPIGIAVDASGNVYIGDFTNHRIRKITSAGVVSTLAGSGTAAYADGAGTAASFNNPAGVAVDATGNVYVADFGNDRIRRISPTGIVTTVAGSGIYGYADGLGTVARLGNPAGVAVDASGNIYVAENGNNRIRKISLTTGNGYSVSPTLPAGLSLDATTGIISGTPSKLTVATNYIVTAVNASGRSSYTINITVNNSLPLTLLNFGAQQQNNSLVNLLWQTTNEVNTSHFTIQRSVDGTSYSDIGKVAAKGGGDYSFIDSQIPNTTIVYYRLKMVDNDGKYSYSKVVAVSVNIKGETLKLFPNPVKETLFVQLTSTKAESVTVQITDMQGKVLQQQQVPLQTGNTNTSINTSALTKGSYLLVVKGEVLQQKQFIKQ